MEFQNKRRMLRTNNNTSTMNNNTNTTDSKMKDNSEEEDVSSTSPYNINARAMEIVSNLPSYVQACMTDDIKLQYEGVHNIRLILSIANDPPIQLVINSGIVPRLVYFLGDENYLQFTHLQFECIWCLTNILSGPIEFSRDIIANGIISILMQLMKTQSDLKILEQVIWCLSNIAGDSIESRNLILYSGVFSEFERLCTPSLNETQAQISVLRIVTWAIANCIRGHPSPDWNILKIAIRSLNIMLTSMDDIEILADVCWGFVHLTAVGDQHPLQLQSIKNIGAIKKIIDLLENESFIVKCPALRVVGNIVSNDDFTQVALNLGLLQRLAPLLEDSMTDIRRECCWTLANIAAGNEHEIQQLLDENLIPILINLLKNDLFCIKKEVIWILCNITVKGNNEQICYLVEQQFIQHLCAFLYQLENYSIACAILDGMENILEIGKKHGNGNFMMNAYAKCIEECGGVRNMELLQTDHNLPNILDQKISKLLKEYFFNDNDIIVGDNDGDGCLYDVNELSDAQKAYFKTQLKGISNFNQIFNDNQGNDGINNNMNVNENNSNIKFNF